MEQNEQIAKIFEKSKTLFIQEGVRNVTMEKIAKELGISKKTIYCNFENKADLVFQSVKYDIENLENQIEHFTKSAENAIHEMQIIGNFVSKSMEKFKSSRINELENFYPKAYFQIDKHRKIFVVDKIRKNVERGIIEDFYRKDLEKEKVVLFYLTATTALFDQKTISIENFTISELYISYLDYHLQGILNEKGRALYSKNKR